MVHPSEVLQDWQDARQLHDLCSVRVVEKVSVDQQQKLGAHIVLGMVQPCCSHAGITLAVAEDVPSQV